MVWNGPALRLKYQSAAKPKSSGAAAALPPRPVVVAGSAVMKEKVILW
jgi:hypothetical protein